MTASLYNYDTCLITRLESSRTHDPVRRILMLQSTPYLVHVVDICMLLHVDAAKERKQKSAMLDNARKVKGRNFPSLVPYQPETSTMVMLYTTVNGGASEMSVTSPSGSSTIEASVLSLAES